MNQYLFTYGMLTNRDIMDDSAALIGAGQLKDWAFEMLTFANVRPESGDLAHGVLWEIDDAILESCDRREGYPSLYTRVQVPIEVGDSTYTAWVYTLTPDGRNSYMLGRASGHYVESVLEGYLQHGVDTQQILPAFNDMAFDPNWHRYYTTAPNF